ncbi:MAG TPA: peptide chain release factor N(5)-glutamine methyltransferase [Candidatus Saccharibacteria bacterium]|jgi:release factor glutamine methyltransferase|nr:peptide chain release factor N(5)-glutamine methyltransferase [Candidatus Saccharibacteria bacterium]HMT55905.1 peptide chain release factor N(5)-glutamine methyltransferase [Candidatus Saccharibacteria bacterium]
MKISEWLERSIALLKKNDIPTPKLDAEVLLADTLNKDRSWLVAHGDDILEVSLVSTLDSLLSRRCKHEPLAYIRGKQEFYGRDFFVSPDTLTPRPETETLVECAQNYLNHHPKALLVSDIGTGSGCIAISLALDIRNAQHTFMGYDISADALKQAHRNKDVYKASVAFIHADFRTNTSWLNSDLIVANLPYVPDEFHINLAASHEPSIALFGGDSGLDYYTSLFTLCGARSVRPKAIITESLPFQHETLEKIAQNNHYRLSATSDFIQLFEAA